MVILLPLGASKQRQEHRDKGRGQVGAELAVMYEMPVGFSLQRYNLPSYFAFSIHDSEKQNRQELFGR